MAHRSMIRENAGIMNKGLNPLVNFNFLLRVELAFDLPCKSVKAFTRENEYEFIQEGGLNDYVHMRRKPISKPFTFEVERYVGVDYFDPIPNGAELALPVFLIVTRHAQWLHLPTMWARQYAFTGCTVMKKTYGELNAEQSGLMTETTTIAFREMLVIDTPLNDAFDYIPDMPLHKGWIPPARRPENESDEHLKLRKEMQDLEKQLKEIERKKIPHERERKAIEKELTELNKKKAANDKTLKDAENKVPDTEKEIEKLKEALENNEKEIKDVKENLARLEGEIGEYEEKVAEFEEQLAGLQEMLENAKSASERDRINMEITSLKKAHEPDRVKFQALKDKIASLTALSEELPKEKERIEKELKEEQKTLEKAKTALEKAKKDHTTEEKKIEEAIKDAQERFKKKNADIAAVDAEVKEHKKKIEAQRDKMKKAGVSGY
jgi:predicted  nucleic acid-binding Zn-ribbon protein